MHALRPTIGLILLAAWPAGLLAQVVSEEKRATEAVGTHAADELSPRSTPSSSSAEPLLLKRRASDGHADSGKRADGLQSLMTIGGSLAVVLGIFFAVVWMFRRASPKAFGTLPAEVFEVLGRAALANHQQVHLLRLGNKLLLVSVAAVGGASTLAEITDPAEIERLADLCRQARPSSPTAALRQVFKRAEAGNG
jgi:flagellar protein FliO/FliZ